MMKRRSVRPFLVLAGLALGMPSLLAADPAARHVAIDAPDGVELAATYWSPGKPGPGIVLLHMCNSSREAWFGLGGQLARKGFHVLALDYRGYGGSGGERSQDPQQQGRNITEKWPGDVDAAFAFLTSQTGVDRQHIGAAGGSCGVDQAIQLARRHSEVKTLVLLAGGTNREGENFLDASPWLPILAVAADDDGNAVQEMEWLSGFSVNERNRLLRYADGGHGTALFPIHTDLEPAIADWFVEHLITHPVVAAKPASNARRGRSAEVAEALRAPGGAAKVRASGNKPQLPPEGIVNLMGYEKLQAGDAKGAIELFRLNVDLHPESANTYDSLADAYLADGQRDLAREMVEKAIAVLDADPDPDSEFEGAVRASAEAKRKELVPAAQN